jgi:hypothetical protein
LPSRSSRARTARLRPSGLRRGSLHSLRERRLVVCAVKYEPVSTCNSLLTGNLTGNFAISTLLQAISEQKTPVPQPLLGKFPTQINRENITRNREFFAGIRELAGGEPHRPTRARGSSSEVQRSRQAAGDAAGSALLRGGLSILIPMWLEYSNTYCLFRSAAPARGATRFKQIVLNAKTDVFRPALPHRERPGHQLLPFQSVCFGPRSRTGRR